MSYFPSAKSNCKEKHCIPMYCMMKFYVADWIIDADKIRDGCFHQILTKSVELEFDLKYDGYVQRQQQALAQFARNEDSPIPRGLDYLAIETLCMESRQRLQQLQPANFGQASRISGVRPADLTALWIHVEKQRYSHDKA